MIHNAVRDMVLDNHGDSVWNQILDDSGVGADVFLAMQNYDDQVVLSLVGSACKILEIEPPDCLDAFGQYWVLHTALDNYGTLMDSFGNSIWDLLANLDHMHDRISNIFQQYNAPSFELEKQDQKTYLLHYRSSRSGLEAFVVGLLKGLAINYDKSISIDLIESSVSGEGQYSVFRLVENN
jgi:hypothetical protein